MSLSLVIFDNPTPDEALPLLATHDPTVIAVVRQALLARLGDQPAASRDKIRFLLSYDEHEKAGDASEVPA